MTAIKKFSIVRFIISLTIFVESMDATIINTSIPNMSIALQVFPINLKIALISYLLAVAIFTPISGWMADRWGSKKMFMIAFLIFTLSSLGCGLSHSLNMLMVMRFIQGIGGAFMMPIGRLFLVRSVSRTELVRAMGQVMMLGSLGMVCGPALGGLITDYFSWPWIFFVNVPVGLIVIVISYYYLKDMPKYPVFRFDLRGFLLFGLGLALFTFGLSMLSESGFAKKEPFIFMALAVGLFFLYFWHAKYKEHPVINMQLFQVKKFRLSVFGNLLARLGFGGIPFLLPMLLQFGFHYSSIESGLMLVPIALGIMVSKTITSGLLHRFGYRRFLMINTLLIALNVASFFLINRDTHLYFMIAMTFIYGILTSLQYSGMNSMAYLDLSEESLSSATSIMSTVQQLGQSFGVALAAILLHASLWQLGYAALEPIIFKSTFLLLALATCLPMIVFSRLKRDE